MCAAAILALISRGVRAGEAKLVTAGVDCVGVDLIGEEVALCRRLLRESRYVEIFDETFGPYATTQ